MCCILTSCKGWMDAVCIMIWCGWYDGVCMVWIIMLNYFHFEIVRVGEEENKSWKERRKGKKIFQLTSANDLSISTGTFHPQKIPSTAHPQENSSHITKHKRRSSSTLILHYKGLHKGLQQGSSAYGEDLHKGNQRRSSIQ